MYQSITGISAQIAGTSARKRSPYRTDIPYNVFVPEMLLQTKLYVPPIRPNLVPRPRLIDHLNQGLQLSHKFTLISAAAGFGKTTLISEWVQHWPRPVAWLSLDEEDNEPARFLTYVIAALQTIVPSIGAGIATILQSPEPPPVSTILVTLINELATVPE